MTTIQLDETTAATPSQAKSRQRFASMARSQTKTPDTIMRYTRIYENLAERAAEIYDSEASPENTVAFLIDHLKPTLRAVTWRQYRAAVLHKLRCLRDAGALSEDGQAALARLEKESSAGTITRRARRRRCLPDEDLGLLMRHLRKRAQQSGRRKGSAYAALAANWLWAIRLTGLRPIEWFGAELHEGELGYILTCVNAKHTNGRGGPKERRALDLATLLERDVSLIRTLIRLFRERARAGKIKETHSGAADAIRAACRELWPRRRTSYTLYSARHAFAAAAKASGRSKEEISLMMGHATENQTSRYGPLHLARRNGRKANFVQLPLLADEGFAGPVISLPRPQVGVVTSDVALAFERELTEE